MSELSKDPGFEQYAPITDGIAVRGIQEELRVDVTLNFKLLNECAEATMNLLEKRCPAGFVPAEEEGRFKKFLYSLLIFRVLYSAEYPKFKKFGIHQNELKVPFWFALILGAIGKTHDSGQNVYLMPAIKYNLPDVYSADEIREYIRHLASRYPDLIPLVDFPKDPTGSLRYMSIISIGGALRGYKDATHPTYALFSTVVEKLMAEQAYDVLFRHDYGTVQEYTSRLNSGGIYKIVSPAAGS